MKSSSENARSRTFHWLSFVEKLRMRVDNLERISRSLLSRDVILNRGDAAVKDPYESSKLAKRLAGAAQAYAAAST